jgi:hypothetical protein
MVSSKMEPVTFGLVADCLNQLRYRVPPRLRTEVSQGLLALSERGKERDYEVQCARVVEQTYRCRYVVDTNGVWRGEGHICRCLIRNSVGKRLLNPRDSLEFVRPLRIVRSVSIRYTRHTFYPFKHFSSRSVISTVSPIA